jgi:FemAB-related protein (PEP-CTERM system-associated)
VESLLRESARQMAQYEQVQYLELREQQPIADEGFLTKELYVTFDLELPDSAEKLQRIFPRDTRYMIRKAQKNGLEAIVDNRAIDTFYEVYSRSFHNLGTPVFSKRLFQIILEEFGERCELTTVRREGKALASVLSFRFKDWILPYFGGSLIEGRQYAANNFMYWEVMKRALEMGIRHFDFGRSKLGSGSYTFKTQWNMRERPLPYQFALVRRKSLPNFSPANPKFKLAISIWRSMPFELTKVLGPPLVQLFP